VLARGRFRGKAVLDAVIDLPFAVSPVVVGLALVLLFGREGWFADLPFQVIFSVPGMVLATVFVSLPFVVREVTPVLREIGDEQEQAAATLGAGRWTTFRRITLPAIRWGLAYGVVLATARAIGEFGAVSVVSGRSPGRDRDADAARREALPELRPGRGAYAASALLASSPCDAAGMTASARKEGHVITSPASPSVRARSRRSTRVARPARLAHRLLGPRAGQVDAPMRSSRGSRCRTSGRMSSTATT
jgi:hypothetical protein